MSCRKHSPPNWRCFVDQTVIAALCQAVRTIRDLHDRMVQHFPGTTDEPIRGGENAFLSEEIERACCLADIIDGKNMPAGPSWEARFKKAAEAARKGPLVGLQGRSDDTEAQDATVPR